MAQDGRTQHELFEKNKTFYRDDFTTFSSRTIRLLDINAGAFHDPIVCKLQTVTLVPDLIYRALSYAWNTEPGWLSITVNGTAGFQVTGSLFGGLRRLRQTGKATRLWIDAICINQANLEERSAQVAIMADIFRSAELVYVWLGPCGQWKPTSEELEECCYHEVKENGTIKYLAPCGQRGSISQPLCGTLHPSKVQWWWRTWAIQEVALARNVEVLVGPHQMSWETCLSIIEPSAMSMRRLSTEKINQIYDDYSLMTYMNIIRDGKARNDWDLHGLLRWTLDHDATDPRDKVYGILGLLKDRENSSVRIIPDYSKTYEQVCTDATLYIIKVERSLDVLIGNWHGSVCSPYWARDFTNRIDDPLSLLQYPLPSEKSAERIRKMLQYRGASRIAAEFRHVGKSLYVNGILFDEVKVVAHRSMSASAFLSTWDVEPPELLKDVNLVRLLQKRRTESSNRLGRINRTPVSEECTLDWLQELTRHVKLEAESTLDVGVDPIDQNEQFERTVAMDEHLRIKAEKATDLEEALDFEEFCNVARSSYGDWDDYRDDIEWELRDRSFLITKRGICGISRPNARVGDMITVLFGASVPILLRPMDTGSKYMLLGDCFVSGLMYGELMKPYREGKLPKREFHLV